jgi:hypothetical protein
MKKKDGRNRCRIQAHCRCLNIARRETAIGEILTLLTGSNTTET